MLENLAARQRMRKFICTRDASHAEYVGFLMNMDAMLERRIQTMIIGARNLQVNCQYAPGLYPVISSMSFVNLKKYCSVLTLSQPFFTILKMIKNLKV